jgi:type I restriction enzyme S subunit
MDVIKEHSLVPKLRFAEFEDNWITSTVDDVFKVNDGTHQTPKYVSDGIPFVSVESIKDLYSTKKFITEEAFEKGYKIKPKKNDIFMTRITAGIIGDTAIVKDDKPLAYYVSLALLRNKTKNNINFLEQRINTPIFKRELHKRIIHVAFPKKINLGDINKCSFSFPSLPEQQKIASFLSAVDDKLQQLTKKKELLEEYKKGVMQQIFSQELRFKDDNGNNYPDWEKNNLGKICSVIKGKQLNKSELTETGLYPALNGGINPSGYTDKWNTEKDVITISEGGNSCGYLNLSKTRFWCGGHCYSLLKLQSNINFKYLFQILKFSEAHIMRLRVGSGLPNIQMKEINKFSVKIPEIDEQQKIANSLYSLDNKIELVSTQIENTQSFKKGLLQQMFV